MNAELQLYSEHCAGSPTTASVTAGIYNTSGVKVGDEIRMEQQIDRGQQEISGTKLIELNAGGYYVSVESKNGGARFMKQGINISAPGTFHDWKYVAMA